METLTLNLRIGKARRVTENGREYFVAPVTSIVTGVLAGSQGALYYPPEDIRNSTRLWDGIPVVINHPSDPISNRPLSASEPGVFESQGVGVLKNSRYTYGKLQHEAWLDKNALEDKAPEVYNALLEGSPVEVSTGLHTQNEPAVNGVYQGRPYNFVAKNYTPDHLAILPKDRGACSIDDGCGLLMNERREEPMAENASVGKYGNPKSLASGKFKKAGSGTGAGEVHEAAQHGEMLFTDRDRELGREAETYGGNPPWVSDPVKWARAIEKADQDRWDEVAHIYLRLGGEVQTQNCGGPGSGMPGPCPGGGGGGNEDSGGFNSSVEGARKAAEASRSIVGYKSSKKAAASSKEADRASILADGKGRAGNHAAMKAHTSAMKAHKDASNEAALAGDTDRMLIHDRASRAHRDAAKFHQTRGREYTHNSTNGELTMTLTTNQRKVLIDNLINNGCGCWGEEDRKVLEGFDDKRLTKLIENSEQSETNEKIVQVVREKLGGQFLTLTVNEMPAALAKAKMAPAAPAEEEEETVPEEDTEETIEGEAPVKEKPVANKQVTFEQMLASASEEQRAVWNSAVKIHKEAKDKLIERLITNVHNAEKRKALYTRLVGKSLDELKDMLEMVPVQPTQNKSRTEEDLPSWVGAAGFHGQTQNAQEDMSDDLLDLPTMNYAV